MKFCCYILDFCNEQSCVSLLTSVPSHQLLNLLPSSRGLFLISWPQEIRTLNMYQALRSVIGLQRQTLSVGSQKTLHPGRGVGVQLTQSSLTLMSTTLEPQGYPKGGVPGRGLDGRTWPMRESRASHHPPNTWMEKYGVEGLGVVKELYIQRWSLQAQSNDLNCRHWENSYNLLIAYRTPVCSQELPMLSNDSSNGSFDRREETKMLSNVINVLQPIKKGLRIQWSTVCPPNPYTPFFVLGGRGSLQASSYSAQVCLERMCV